MDFDVFKKIVMDEMRERFPNLEFGSREMKKLQGESYEGLMVTLPGSKVSASLNLDAYYERTNTGASEHQVMDTIESAVREASQNMPQFDWNVLGNYEQMKEALMLQMIPVKGNEEKLAEIPHEMVEDMAVVYRFDLGSNERGVSSVLVSDTMLKSYDITRERLAADAIDAAVKNHPASLWKRQKSKSRKPLFVRKTLQRAFSFPSAVYRRESRLKECKQHEYHLNTEWRLSYPEHHFPQDQAPRTLRQTSQSVSGNAPSDTVQ